MEDQRKSPIGFKKLSPKRGSDRLLRCSENLARCPSLGFTNPNHIPEEAALNYLARLLVQAYLDRKANERKQLQQHKKGSDLCAGVNQGTSRGGK